MKRNNERGIWVAILMIVLAVFVVLGGCSTTPNTVEQWDAYYARQDTRERKAACAANGGKWIEDNSVGRSGEWCISQQAYDEGLSRARRLQ